MVAHQEGESVQSNILGEKKQAEIRPHTLKSEEQPLLSRQQTADLMDETSCEDPEEKNTDALVMLLIVMVFNTGTSPRVLWLLRNSCSYFVQYSNSQWHGSATVCLYLVMRYAR